MEVPPYFTPMDRPDRMDESLTSIIPNNANLPYDMVDLVEMVVDDGEFYQVHEHYAAMVMRLGSSATNPRYWPALSTLRRRVKQQGSFDSAMRSTSRWLRS